MLQNVSVKGEVSNCKYHSSGHIYFTVKDEQGAISAIMFKGSRAQGLRFPMKDGDRIVVTGAVRVYEKGGTYQIYAREVQPDGAGDLYVRYEKLKKELEEMGMFAPEYKKAIPRFAKRIGIVTAPTGAAVRDIIQIAKRRNPFVELILYPAQVQGEGAAASIISGIVALDGMDLDVLIVGRGGGSIEDLWAFNEEAVARAVFSCHTPVISAVGHETDTTIIDYVSDLRAPTPSAAAEQAVFSYQDVLQSLQTLRLRLNRDMTDALAQTENRILQLEKQLRYLSPIRRLDERRQYAMTLEQRMEYAFDKKTETLKATIALLAGKLDGASPLKRLASGYAYTEDAAGNHITSVKEIKPNDEMTIYMSDGRIHSKIQRIDEDMPWKKS